MYYVSGNCDFAKFRFCCHCVVVVFWV